MKTNISSTAEGWDKVLENSPMLKDYTEKEERYFIENVSRDSIVFDAGCANGRLLLLLHNKVKRIIGVDVNKDAVEQARIVCSKTKNVEVFNENVTKTHFTDSFFDVSLYSNIFQNLGDAKIRTLKEAVRVTKPGGKIFASVYSDKALKERLKVYEILKVNFTVSDNVKGTVILHLGDGDHTSEQFSKSDLLEICNQVNQNDVEVVPLNEISYMLIITVTK